MRTALHPGTLKSITVTEFIKDLGNDRFERSERAICPICRQRMSVSAPSAPNSEGHFAHLPGSGYCPTKNQSGLPYTGLFPKCPDMESAKRIKKEFCNTWKKHYKKLDSIVIGLNCTEFLDVLKLSLRERIWEYSKLESFQIPYIFSTLMDYPPQKSYKRKDGSYVRQYWFRCWFDSSVACYDDLWIHRSTPLSFWRGSYRLQNGKRKPGIEDIVKFYEIEMSKDFLTTDIAETALPNFVVEKVEVFINKYFAEI